MTGPVLAPGRQAKPDKVPEQLDDAVKGALPPGSTVLSIQASGHSSWVQTLRIDVQHGDGSTKPYFMKSESGQEGCRMMEGSFESERLMYEYAPDHVPRPTAWGSCTSEPDTYFLLSDFREMENKVPDVEDFVRLVVALHNDSAGNSPNGKFGFHVPTHLGYIPNDNTWQDSWEVWFSNAMRRMFEIEERSHGNDDSQQELECLKEALFEKVIPRLLRPLESHGRRVIPTLIHSDLWPGNVMVDSKTRKSVMFDSCAYWGHSESDLGPWRAPRYRLGESYIKEYRDQMGISAPEGDFNDRNRLYAIRYDLLVSAMWPENKTYRLAAMKDIKYLIDKFPGGYEAYICDE